MEPHLLDPTSLRWSSSIPLTYTTCSLKVLKETKPTSNPPFLFVRAGKRSSGSSQNGLQRQPKKDLSRILRTEAAISGIERKANSRKYSTLWPKAVLEALDEAIRENRYESALKFMKKHGRGREHNKMEKNREYPQSDRFDNISQFDLTLLRIRDKYFNEENKIRSD
uniref:Pentatricopeptide repeat-containing protein n=1 Tax=Vitis vinifera TaxID=29760 RepID=A5BMQ0_VITVI|nr:hypothetical protein VITISV_022679 [Vitis vinifera]